MTNLPAIRTYTLSITPYKSPPPPAVIEVIDKETGDTIKQIPPEERLRLSEHMKEVAEGTVDTYI